jgi:uncharacterized protein YeaO (DUF488 family)
MKTSNFAHWQRQKFPGAISISRFPAYRSGWNGPEFPPLMPSAQLLKAYKDGDIDWAEYRWCYQQQLDCLNPQKVLISLKLTALGFEPILLCYESAKTLDTQPCHRRLVAEWLERELDIDVPEWSKP